MSTATTQGAPAGAHRPEGWWAWPPLVAACTYIAAWLPHWGAALPWWAMVVAGVAWSVASVPLAYIRYPEHEFGRHARSAAWLGVLSGLVIAVWLPYAGATSPMRALPWLALATVVLGLWHVVLVLRAPRAAAREMAAAISQSEQESQSQWSEIFAAAGETRVRVMSCTVTDSGETIECEPIRQPGRATTTYLQFVSRLPDIAVEADRAFAPRGVRIREEDLTPEQGAGASGWLLHVGTVARPSSAEHSYERDERIGDPHDELPVGHFTTDRAPLMLSPRAHTKIVGATTSGKSTFLHNVIGRTTARRWQVWIAASNKLPGLTIPWLWPWITGTVSKPTVSYIGGQRIEGVLRLLADAYHEACIRNARLGRRKTDFLLHPPILVILEEASHALRQSRRVIMTHDGTMMSASQLVAAIAECGASAGVYVWLATQYGLFGAGGPFGSEMERNFTQRLCGRTMQSSDGTNTLTGMSRVDTTTLTDHTFLVQPNATIPRATPAKSARFEDDDVPAVAERQAAWVPDLPLDDTSPLQHWSHRWCPRLLPELVAVAAAEGYDWPVRDCGNPRCGELPPTGITPETYVEMMAEIQEGITPDRAAGPPSRSATTPHPSSPPASGTGGDQVVLPVGFDRSDYNVGDLLEAMKGGAVSAPHPQPTPPGEVELLPASEIAKLEAAAADAVRNVEEESARRRAEFEAIPQAPDPLGAIVRALTRRGAPTEWVSASDLAVAIGRCDKTADELDRARAAQILGGELRRQVPDLEVTQPRQGRDPETGAELPRRRGYSVPALIAAARALDPRK